VIVSACCEQKADRFLPAAALQFLPNPAPRRLVRIILGRGRTLGGMMLRDQNQNDSAHRNQSKKQNKSDVIHASRTIWICLWFGNHESDGHSPFGAGLLTAPVGLTVWSPDHKTFGHDWCEVGDLRTTENVPKANSYSKLSASAMALRMAFDLFTVSSNSYSASLSATMPPPA